jgi:hypothetical protein
VRLVLLLFDLLNGEVGLLLLKLLLLVRSILGSIDLILIVFVRFPDHAAIGLLKVGQGLAFLGLYLGKPFIVIVDVVVWSCSRHLYHLFM